MKFDIKKEIESKLPTIQKEVFKDEISTYGFSRIVADKLEYKKIPFSYGGWMHGWVFLEIEFPEQLLALSYNPQTPYIVATQEQAEYLNSKGYRNIIAGGLPFLYSDDVKGIKKIPGSLLVMPGHSPRYGLKKIPYEKQKYIDHILKYKEHFSNIVFCLNQNCIKYGYWIKELEAAGIPYIAGAESCDINSFKRLKTIFSHFEYMTTNQIGSHVLYASFCGVKVSISSKFIHNPLRKVEKSPKKIDDVFAQNLNQDNIEKMYPQFCVEPHKATNNKEWAAKELGQDCMIPIEKIPEIFRWNDKIVQLYGVFSGSLMCCQRKEIFKRVFFHAMKKIIQPFIRSKSLKD